MRLAAALFRLGLLLATLLPVIAASAHPSHGSYAEVEWNADGGLDVALRFAAEDMERALSVRAAQPVVLRDEPAVRRLLGDYIGTHFHFLAAPGSPAIHLVGMELDHRASWIYFTLAAPPSREEATLRNSLLMDVEPSQTNRVRRLWAPDEPVLVFTSVEPMRHLAGAAR